jgi:hypothetical protein
MDCYRMNINQEMREITSARNIVYAHNGEAYSFT